MRTGRNGTTVPSVERAAAKRTRGKVPWLALAALLLISPVGRAQVDTYEDRAAVVEVQVPVNVTDRHGEPVRGLSAEDFELLDNGKAQEIRRFEVIDLEQVEPRPGLANVAREEIPPAARRRFLFLFDFSFSSPANLLRARQAAQRFVVESLHPTDLAAVATHTVDSGPEIVLTFTPDRAALARAIDQLGLPRMLQVNAQDPLRFMIGDLASQQGALGVSPEAGATDLGAGSVRSQAQQQYMGAVGREMQRAEKSFARGKIASWTSSMQLTARLLASVPGRKHVIYFTEGFDGRLLLGRQPDINDPEDRADVQNSVEGRIAFVDNDDRFGNTQLQNMALQMMAEFQRADSILQVVDISGLDADLPGSGGRRRQAGRDALFWIADGTGGNLFEDANDFGYQLNEVLGRSTVTYLLTFQPSDIEFDGAEHRIRVKADLPRGTQLSYREGYFAPRAFEELHPIEKGLLAGDLIATAEPRKDLAMSVLAAPFKASAQLAYVPVIVEVEGDSLLVGHDQRQLPVEIYTYVTDEQGEMKDFFTQMVTLDLEGRSDIFARTGLKYYGHLELPVGQYLIRVLVRNASTGRSGVEVVELDIPDFEEEQLALLPPFFLEDPGSWFLVREQASEHQSTTVYPFTVSGQPYIPSAQPALGSRDEAELCIVAYNLGHGMPEVAGQVLDEDGEPVEGGDFELRERTVTGISGLDKLTATFRPRGLDAGRYRLQVEITDPNTRLTRSSSIPFVID